MNRENIITGLLLTVIILASGYTSSVRNDCRNFLGKDYISDEQEYRAEFNSENKADFHAAFFRNTTYRIAVCHEESYGVKFTVKDHEGNMIFTNSDYNHSPSWDFFFENTVDCVITVELTEQNVKPNKGAALLLIGFKK